MIGITGYCQSKKKQIEVLNSKLDSLNHIVSNERFSNSELTKELSDSINFYKINFKTLQTKNTILESDNKKIKTELEKLIAALQNKTQEIERLRNQNIMIQDSLLTLKEANLKTPNFEGSSDDCWKDVPLVDTLLFSNNKKKYIMPIDSSEFSIGNNCQKLTFTVDNQTIANKKFVKCFFRNGTSKTFYNDLGPNKNEYYDSYLQFVYKGSVKEIDYFLIERVNAEWTTFLLIDKENGNEIEVCAEPKLANNKNYLISSKTSGIQEDLFQILNVRENGKVIPINFKYFTSWQFDAIKFIGTQELLIRKSIDSCSKYKYGKLILD